MADSTDQSKAGQVLSFVVVAALVALLVVVGIEAFPHHVKNAAKPNWLDNIVANSVVIFAVRLALFFAVVYVGTSVVGLIGGRRWIAELGPFKASAPIAKLEHSAEALEKDLRDGLEIIERLEERLRDSDDRLVGAQAQISSLIDHIDTMEAEKEGV